MIRPLSKSWPSILMLLMVVGLISFIFGVIIPDMDAAIAADHAGRYTISTIGADGKEGQRWEHVQIVIDQNAYVRFIDRHGHEVEITGPRIRVRE